MGNDRNQRENPSLISYLTLRKAVGILGTGLPVILVVGSVVFGNCREIQSSISAYYHTGMRDIFVGIISAIALFLFAYKGYDRADAIAGNLACVFALVVAFFPTSVNGSPGGCIPESVDNGIISTIHYIAAAGFFLVLSYFSLFLFTRSVNDPTPMKLKRNRLYRVCGYTMLVSIALIGAFSICLRMSGCQQLQRFHPTFWLETIALWAFGISWLTKGKAILADR